jgi:UPF0271 protein
MLDTMLLELDAGEHEHESEDLWSLFDVLNVACGGHAGDSISMTRIAAFCAARARPAIGAHPSYPDRAGFGRRSIEIDAASLAREIERQCATLAQIAGAVRWVKPHGALYHDAAARPDVARAVIAGAIAALGRELAVIGSPSGALRDAAQVAGVRYLREGFADRRTRDDGSLVPRSQPDALITDPSHAAAQARALAPAVDALCVHADTLGALAIARAVREALGG